MQRYYCIKGFKTRCVHIYTNALFGLCLPLPVACCLPLPLLFHLSGEGGNWSLERSLPIGDYFKLSCIWVLLLWLPSRVVLIMKNLHTDTLLNRSAQNNTNTSYS